MARGWCLGGLGAWVSFASHSPRAMHSGAAQRILSVAIAVRNEFDKEQIGGGVREGVVDEGRF